MPISRPIVSNCQWKRAGGRGYLVELSAWLRASASREGQPAPEEEHYPGATRIEPNHEPKAGSLHGEC